MSILTTDIHTYGQSEYRNTCAEKKSISIGKV